MDSIQVATIQILVREGLARCTTTRIAERAGISVGSLYQYYPNLAALLSTVLETHLDRVARAMERACAENRGKTVEQMAAAVVSAFLSVKLGNPAESKALYAVAEELRGAKLVARARARTLEAAAAMLASATEAHFADPSLAAMVAFNALVGPVRLLLEEPITPHQAAELKRQLVLLVTAYLQTINLAQLGRTSA